MAGRFVVLEGGDGSGKSTQAARLAAATARRGLTVCETFEPGATGAGAVMRELLLHGSETIAPTTETLLMAADRAQHVAEQIAPALARGEWVVCDRYLPSSLVYQGVVRAVGVDVVEAVNHPALVENVEPDLVVVLDVSDEVAAARAGAEPRPHGIRGRDLPVRGARRLPFARGGTRLGRARRQGPTSTPSPTRCGRGSASCWPDEPDETVGMTGVSERWEQVVGQDRAVALLQRAAERPVHAYLLVGPRGSGADEAARCFAAAVLAPDDDRVWDLARRGRHPDIVEIDPADNQIRVEHAQEIIDEAFSSPVEGARKAIIVFEAERLNETAANRLLKTLEEPPATALIVLVTSGADQLLATIRSRCQRVDFAHLSASTIKVVLTDAGVAPDRAELVARLAGGRLDRARALDGPLAGVRDAFVTAAAGLDGSGGAVARGVAAVQEAMQDANNELEVRQAAGDRVAHRGARARRVRAARRAHAAEAARRPAQARAPARAHRVARSRASPRSRPCTATRWPVPASSSLNVDRAMLSVDPRGAAGALDACRAARQALAEFNPNETLLLERLFLHLPAVRGAGPARSTSTP